MIIIGGGVMPRKSNGWNTDRKVVLYQLKELESDSKEHGQTLMRIREDIAMLKVKSGVWGLLGGSIPVAILLILEWVK